MALESSPEVVDIYLILTQQSSIDTLERSNISPINPINLSDSDSESPTVSFYGSSDTEPECHLQGTPAYDYHIQPSGIVTRNGREVHLSARPQIYTLRTPETADFPSLKPAQKAAASALLKFAKQHKRFPFIARAALDAAAPVCNDATVRNAEYIWKAKLYQFWRKHTALVVHNIYDMPALLDDPETPAHDRVSGGVQALEDVDLQPFHITLKDRVTQATIVPYTKYTHVPDGLARFLCDVLNKEIDKGDTYPMMEHLAPEIFLSYWFGSFAAVVVSGEYHPDEPELHISDEEWPQRVLGSFYIKPNYPGRSSHICNGGFLVSETARNKGVGMTMGQAYLEWAPKLGYTYSVFNLVYSTNAASMRIWDKLGFKKIGRVPGAGNLASSHGEFVDAHIYGRELGEGAEGIVVDQRFEQIKYYLNKKAYPNSSSRKQKSRLRSAAGNYHIKDGQLYHKDKMAISDPQEQYDIVKNIHERDHMGINKTCAAVTAHYHWTGIKSTTALVIKNCVQCRTPSREGTAPRRRRSPKPTARSESRGSAGEVVDPITAAAGSQRQWFPQRRIARGRTATRADVQSTGVESQLQDELNLLAQQNQQILASQPRTIITDMYNIDPDLMDGVQHTLPSNAHAFQPAATLQSQPDLTTAEMQAIFQRHGLGANIGIYDRGDDDMVQAAQNAIENLDQQQMQNEVEEGDNEMKQTLLMAGYGDGSVEYGDQA